MCLTDDITFINNIFNKDFPLTHLAYDIQVKIYQIQIRFENYFGNYFRIFTITFINKVNSISLRDLSRNQLMKLVKNIRFQNKIAFTELSYHFKMSLNFTHTKKNILNEYSISISNQSIISKQRFDFKRKLRFKNSISKSSFYVKIDSQFCNGIGDFNMKPKFSVDLDFKDKTSISAYRFSTSGSILK